MMSSNEVHIGDREMVELESAGLLRRSPSHGIQWHRTCGAFFSGIVFRVLIAAMTIVVLVTVLLAVRQTQTPWTPPYHDLSFPGRNDATSQVNACIGGLIVELERAYSAKESLPHSLFLLSKQGSPIQEDEIPTFESFDWCCNLPPPYSNQEDAFNSTIAEWIDHCRLQSDGPFESAEGYPSKWSFKFDDLMETAPPSFWYDSIFPQVARLGYVWMSCEDYQGQLSDWGSTCQEVVTAATNGSSFRGHECTDEYSTTVLIPDRLNDSFCWQVACQNDVQSNECVQFTQSHLVEVSLEEYIDVLKQMEMD